MSMMEFGALASAVIAVITLSGKIVNLITSIQSLINRLDQLQEDMTTTKELWADTAEKYGSMNQRLRHIEYELAII